MFVKPEEVIKNFSLEPGMVVADFGAGSGHYVIEAAKIVRNSGKVYAIDIQKELLSAIKSKAETNNLNNIEIIWSDLEASSGSRLKENSVNLVIVSNILFQAENKKVIIEEARRILKNDERLIVIEWLKEDGPIAMGPSNEQRIAKNDCISLVAGLGFKMEKDFNAGEHHYGLIFKKL